MILISVLLFIPLGFILASALLFGISRLFKIDKVKFVHSMLVVFLVGLTSTVIKGLFSFVDGDTSSALSSLVALLVSYYVFHKLLEYFYKIDWKKSLSMYLVYLVGMAVIAVVVVIGVILSVPWVSNPT